MHDQNIVRYAAANADMFSTHHFCHHRALFSTSVDLASCQAVARNSEKWKGHFNTESSVYRTLIDLIKEPI